jgi:hypothetical protein
MSEPVPLADDAPQYSLHFDPFQHHNLSDERDDEAAQENSSSVLRRILDWIMSRLRARQA